MIDLLKCLPVGNHLTKDVKFKAGSRVLLLAVDDRRVHFQV